MRSWVAVVVAAFLCLLSSPLLAEKLIGGAALPPGELPEVIYIQQGASRCSAAIVSPKGAPRAVILTAGHCSTQGGEITPVRSARRVPAFKAICTQSPEYARTRAGVDVALCLADRPLAIEGAVISKRNPKLGEVVRLTGFGCLEGARRGNDGILRAGLARVSQEAGRDSWFYTEASSGAPAAVCSGDSGSAAFERVSKGHEDQVARRRQILGVNSRGNLRNLSLMTALGQPKAQAFLADWAVRNGAQVCGVSVECR